MNRLFRRVVFAVRMRTANEWDRAGCVHDYSPFASLGKRVRLTGPVRFGSEPWLIHLGDDVTIADGVFFLTHDGGVALFRDEHPDLDNLGEIRVGNGVFIGVDAPILPGVTIGDRSVVGAGSVVTKNVNPGTVVAGNPARVVSTVDEYRVKVLRRAGIEL